MSYHNHGSSYAPSSKYHAGPAPHGFPPASAASSWGTVPTATHHSDAASRYGSHPPGTPAQYGHALPPQMGAGQPPSPENFAQLNPYLAAPRQNNLFFDFASDPRSIPDFLNAQPAFQPALSNMKIAFEGQWNWTLQDILPLLLFSLFLTFITTPTQTRLSPLHPHTLPSSSPTRRAAVVASVT